MEVLTTEDFLEEHFLAENCLKEYSLEAFRLEGLAAEDMVLKRSQPRQASKVQMAQMSPTVATRSASAVHQIYQIC